MVLIHSRSCINEDFREFQGDDGEYIGISTGSLDANDNHL
jgi:hypothetical protein